MSDIKPFDFTSIMSGVTAPQAPAPEQPQMPAAASEPSASAAQAEPSNPVTVKYFTSKGIEQAEALLKKMRLEKKALPGEVDDLIDDPQFTHAFPGDFEADLAKPFPTKLELCEYFSSLFPEDTLEENRKNAGLWTWLAFAYFRQLVKTTRRIKDIPANSRWIYDCDNDRYWVRHFIAGPLYLYRDFHSMGEPLKEILFFSPPSEFGKFIDEMSNKPEGTRLPVTMQTAVRLYYDANAARRVKKGATTHKKPGSISELLRVVAQLAETRDFYGAADADELWKLLPKQFDAFKGEEADA
ncbi:MAG: hypothetical protein IKO55_09170 [Kiritimatiellae bacterium]|nr:hypothetical protein [Kiritimatiellia bacterium]